VNLTQSNMLYAVYIALALLPSIIWLLWYLRKDKHPEPKYMILSVFIWGMLMAFPAILIENLSIGVLDYLSLPPLVYTSILYFIVIALTEELLKFLVVYFRVFKRTIQLDEPIDAMIYMIISALGFAAIENIFLLTPLFDKDFASTLNIAFSRFLGATLLHVLASATIGYYLALSLRKPQKSFLLLIHGFILAIILHGLYNIFIVRLEQNFAFIFPVALMIVSTATAISIFLKKLSKTKSITQVEE